MNSKNEDVFSFFQARGDIKKIAQRIMDNGFMPLPLEPLSNAIYVAKWPELAQQRRFDELWKNKPSTSNIGIYCGDNVAIIDFDAHGAEPNGITAYNQLLAEYPDIFDGCIIDRSAGGGVHVSYKGEVGGKTYFKVGDVRIEVLRGNTQAACPPSVRPHGIYTYLSERAHLNISVDELPRVYPVICQLINEYNQPRTVRAPSGYHRHDELSETDLEVIIDYYLDKEYRSGARHDNGRTLAVCLIACGVDEARVESLVKEYITSRGRSLSDKNEAGRMVEWAVQHRGEPCIPWNAVIDARAERAVKRILGGK
jgi:hypothetical protein